MKGIEKEEYQMAISKETADQMMTQAYEEYNELILGFCRTRLRECRDMAEDCMQKTFMFYYNQLLEGEYIIKVKAYLYRVADNICKAEYTDYVRRDMRTANLEVAEEIPDPRQAIELEESIYYDYDELARMLIKQLSEDEQQLYRMKYQERKSLEEIGELLELKPNTVAKRVSRTRTKIKELVVPALDNYRKGG